VLLSANVGFLAIQSIDRNGSPDRTFAQITSYISAMLSLVIYLVAQILKRHHRYYFHAQAEDGVSLSRVQNVSAVMLTADVSVAEVHRPSEPISNRDCLQPPHCVVSLEVSLLLPSYLCCPLICFCSHYSTSMLTFLAALIYVFFAETSVATRAALGVVFGFLIVAVGLLLYLEREGTVSNEALFSQPWQLFLKWVQDTFSRQAKENSNADTREGKGEGSSRGRVARLVAAFRNVPWRSQPQAHVSFVTASSSTV
jgi:hypothetical protein